MNRAVHMSKHWRSNTTLKLRGLEPMSTAVHRSIHWRSNSIFKLRGLSQWVGTVQLYTGVNIGNLTPYLSCGDSANEYSCTHRSKHWRSNSTLKLRGLSQWVQLYTGITNSIFQLRGLSQWVQLYTGVTNSILQLRGLSQWVQLYTGDLTPYLTYRQDAELLCVGNDELEPLWADVLDGAGGTLDWVLHRPATEGVHQHQASHGYHAHPAAHTQLYLMLSRSPQRQRQSTFRPRAEYTDNFFYFLANSSFQKA